jgi:hypothetical protein
VSVINGGRKSKPQKKTIYIHLCEALVNVIVGETVTGIERRTFAKKTCSSLWLHVSSLVQGPC